MNTKLHARQGWRKVAQRLLGTVLGLCLLGAASTLDVDATPPPVVPVDQQPLTLQPPIPPNITLMLDDSGSMMWDFMPDACYLQGVVCTGTSNGSSSPSGGTDRISSANNDAVIDAANNGVYYNPDIVYTPPPTASGGSYTSYTDMTSVPSDGFNPGNGCFVGSLQNPSSNSGNCDLTKHTTSDLTGENLGATKNLYYSATNAVTTGGTTYSQSITGGTYYSPADQSCQNNSSNYNNVSNYQFAGSQQGTTWNGSSYWKSGTCSFVYGGTTTTYNFFQYSTGPAAGPYTIYYVAANASSCSNHPTPISPDTYGGCVGASDSTGAAAPSTDANGNTLTAGENIANWFAYYHTRIQMAKSGLMTAFSTLDGDFRVGFGSIDGNNVNAIPSLQFGFDDSGSGGGNSNNEIAEVQPFGNGSSGTQKANFWNWIAGENANNGTPLRKALSAVGQYYQQSQPWTTMSSDPGYGTTNAPSNIACRQAYTIMTTDGFWNGDDPSVGQGASDSQGLIITGPNNQSYTYNPAAPYSGGDVASTTTTNWQGQSTTTLHPSLADVAMYYWENDLQPNIANEVPINTADPAFWQHMVTFTMGLGFTPTGIAGSATSTGTTPVTHTPPTISDIFGATTGKETLSSDFGWPAPASNSIYNISDLAHAGVNGHGGFYSATNPQTFAAGISDALKSAGGRDGTGASLAANSTQLNNGTVAYQAKYHTSTWAGELDALPIDSTTGAIGTIKSPGGWSTNTTLTASMADSRDIVTYVPPTSSSGTGTFVAFQNSPATTPPALSSAELSALGSTATAEAQMVNYLRGDNTLEQSQGNGGAFRDRTTPLGDIVDSQPVYVGAPDPNEFENQTFAGINAVSPSTDSFETWAVGGTNAAGQAVASAASQRTPLVYVAANDGMLHAFNVSTGTETYAYLPGAVITAGLANLANPAYGSGSDPHQYYNDGELTVADAYLPSLPQINGSSWHTILVGTTGRGPAKAVYALDVTNPANITPLWERSAGDNNPDGNSIYIGQMVGKPVIAQVADGNWQVLIGNGYNSQAGVGALLEFNLATGALSVHTTDATAGNGLAAPVTWMDDPANGISMEAYAGDLFGRVWKFPLDDVGTSGHGSSATTTYTADFTTSGVLEFTALDPSGNAQPITAGLTAGRDPVTGNVWVFFGTGRYLSASDLASKQVQSWYGLIVQPGSNQPSLPALPTTTSSGNLVERYITYEQEGNTSASPPTLGVRTVTPMPSPGDMGGKLGWYMNLEQPILNSDGTFSGSGNALGERMVTPNQFQGNLLLATTRIPVVTDICNPSGGGWVMAANPFTGTSPSGNFFLANGGVGSVTINGKAVPVAGVGFSSLPNNPIFVGGDMLMSFDNGTTSSLMTPPTSGTPQRVSWQELVNP